MRVRTIDELANVESPAMAVVNAWVQDSPTYIEILDVDQTLAADALYRLQVTAASVLGALVLHSGGLVADHGWFRILGGGSQGLPSVADANGLGEPTDDGPAPGLLMVAYDALGGRFAIDGGSIGVSPGEVCYFGPDSLSWGGLGGGHSNFVHAVLSGSMGETFASLRWEGWQHEIAALAADEGLSLWPPPFSREGHDIGSVSRRLVPLSELHSFYADAASQLGTVDE